jgi:hypothetical protein
LLLLQLLLLLLLSPARQRVADLFDRGFEGGQPLFDRVLRRRLVHGGHLRTANVASRAPRSEIDQKKSHVTEEHIRSG